MEVNDTNNQNNLTKSAINPVVLGIIITVLLLAIGVFFISSKTETASSPEISIKNVEESTTSVNSMPELTTYTLAEVATHSSETDCWMAINQKVYNVTEFVGKHPGGKAILSGCGKDATTLFNERPTNNKGPHPANAINILESFYIGELKL